MFSVNDDMSIYLTRGDTAYFSVTLRDETNGNDYTFKAGDVVRFKVTEKKACENVIFYKDFPVAEDTKRVDLVLTEEETRIGEVISKPTDYWYEVELNPFTEPHTIIGYDDDGAKVLKLFPEGKDAEKEPITPEDIPVVDEELDGTSTRPVENQAITRRFNELEGMIKTYDDVITKNDDMSIFNGSATMLGGLPAENYVTEAKFNEVNADLKKSVSDGKEEIADAITSKGVNTAIDLSHHELAQNILKIKVGQGDAEPSDVLDGVTFTNASGELLVGTMPDMKFEWNGTEVEVEEDVLYSIFPEGYRSAEWDWDRGLAHVVHPLAEVNKVTGYTDYKNAVVDGLANSGLGVTEETSASELQSILEGKFPASSNVLANLLADEGYSQSSEHFDGSVTKSDKLNIVCSSDSFNRADYSYIKLKGKDTYNMTSCALSFNVEYNKGQEQGTGVDGDLNYAIIRVCNDTGEVAKWEKVGIIDVGTFADTLSFTSVSEWWVEIEVSAGSGYTNAILNINSMVAEAVAGEQEDVWEGIQDGGNRTDYMYGFYAWGGDYIRPTYKVVPTGQTNYMFYRAKVKKIEAKYFDLTNAQAGDTSGSAGHYFTFAENPNLEEIEDIGLQPAYYYATFRDCPNLKKIAVLRVTRNSQYSNTFTGCGSLQEILEIIGEIGQNFNVKDCVDMDEPTLNRIIEHLVDDGTSHTLNVGTNITKISDEKKAEAQGKGWTIV